MKAIDFKSMLIGGLLCAVFMLITGVIDKSNEIGTYQLNNNNSVINTTTGEVWQYMRYASRSIINDDGTLTDTESRPDEWIKWKTLD